MNNKILHFVHLGDKHWSPDPVWNYLNPDWKIKVWNEENVHQLGLAPEQYEHPKLAGSSNIIRLHAVLHHGGVYLDTDMVPIKPLNPLLNYDAFCAFQPSGPNIACNAAFGAMPNHPWIIRMIKAYEGREKESPEIGCYIMNDCVGDDVTVLPNDTFYPYSHDEMPKPHTENTLAIHLWKGTWL